MKNMDWVANLYEVGTPITRSARDIASQIEDANKRLEAAKKLHAEEMESIQRSAAALEQEIARLWTPEEIQAAKRGIMLVGEMECVR